MPVWGGRKYRDCTGTRNGYLYAYMPDAGFRICIRSISGWLISPALFRDTSTIFQPVLHRDHDCKYKCTMTKLILLTSRLLISPEFGCPFGNVSTDARINEWMHDPDGHKSYYYYYIQPRNQVLEAYGKQVDTRTQTSASVDVCVKSPSLRSLLFALHVILIEHSGSSKHHESCFTLHTYFLLYVARLHPHEHLQWTLSSVWFGADTGVFAFGLFLPRFAC